ncbi:MAG TPA: helix-turn-helix transcriptional regulator [Nocardioidaceae bacterium]|nr:helix-turn-helix transcriptional regulator [Nocardioidaceae bacterium]
MALQLRNLTVTPDDPVEDWGVEGLLAAVDRGDLADWRRIIAAVRREPWGGVAQALGQVFAVASDSGVTSALRHAVAGIHSEMEEGERSEVAAQVREYVERSGLSQREFARRMGTSPSRLSTYVNGSVTPSAALMIRMRGVAERCGGIIAHMSNRANTC